MTTHNKLNIFKVKKMSLEQQNTTKTLANKNPVQEPYQSSYLK